jgi:hypothetical protein
MPTLDEEIARSFRTAQLQRRRWQRVYDAFAKEPMRLEYCEQVLIACMASTEIEYREASRRCFDMHDRLATALLRECEGMTQAHRKETLLARAEFHDRLKEQALREGKNDPHAIEHARHHSVLAAQLRDYARHGIPAGLNTAPEQPKATEPEPAKWRPGRRSCI